MASSRKWASCIASIASFLFFLIIMFQLPLFRVPCRSGLCRTPIELTCSQLISSELFPTYVVKHLLYPGAIARAIMENRPLPRFMKLLKLYKLTNVTSVSATSDLQRLEIIAGSYFSVVGAFIGLFKHKRMSLFGMMLIIWGLLREIFLGKSSGMDPTQAVHMYPTMMVATACAFFSVRSDVRKLIHVCKAKRVKIL